MEVAGIGARRGGTVPSFFHPDHYDACVILFFLSFQEELQCSLSSTTLCIIKDGIKRIS